MTQMLLGISPDWIPTLENFVAGHNVELLSALNEAISSPNSEQCIYIWSETGSGKTHLLQASVEKARRIGRTADYASGGVPIAAQLVAVDNVELLDNAGQIALFELCNHQREAGSVLVVSGSTAPLHLNLRDDLRTRLGWGLESSNNAI